MASNVLFTTFDSEAIRDTSVHNGTILDIKGLKVKTIVIENGLDQTVTLQAQASVHSDFSNAFNVGSSFEVGSTTDTYQTSDAYFPFMRLTAQCATAPTSGDLTAYFINTD